MRELLLQNPFIYSIFSFAGLVGLSFSYALGLTSAQVFMIRLYSSLCNYIISVERIKQFMHIQPESPAILEDNRPPISWPSRGRIEFHELKVRRLIDLVCYMDKFFAPFGWVIYFTWVKRQIVTNVLSYQELIF